MIGVLEVDILHVDVGDDINLHAGIRKRYAALQSPCHARCCAEISDLRTREISPCEVTVRKSEDIGAISIGAGVRTARRCCKHVSRAESSEPRVLVA